MNMKKQLMCLTMALTMLASVGEAVVFASTTTVDSNHNNTITVNNNTDIEFEEIKSIIDTLDISILGETVDLLDTNLKINIEEVKKDSSPTTFSNTNEITYRITVDGEVQGDNTSSNFSTYAMDYANGSYLSSTFRLIIELIDNSGSYRLSYAEGVVLTGNMTLKSSNITVYNNYNNKYETIISGTTQPVLIASAGDIFMASSMTSGSSIEYKLDFLGASESVGVKINVK